MATISIRKFMGEVPKAADTSFMLPDGAAQYAENCEFSTGALVPLKAPGNTSYSTSYTPVRSMFFKDTSSKWISYKINSAGRMFQSPVIGDTFERVYYIVRQPANDGVEITPELACVQWAGAQTIGGVPQENSTFTNQAMVGVPHATDPPILTLIDLTSSIPGIADPKIEIRGWWEADGARYQETTLLALSAPSTTPPEKYMREWTITAPTPIKTTEDVVDDEGNPTGEVNETGIPLEAIFGASLTLRDNTQLLFTVSTTTNSAVPGRSSALPGGVELTIKKVSTDPTNLQYTLTLAWGVVETRAYVFTVVNVWNEESMPSPAALVSLNFLQKVKVRCMLPAMRATGTGTAAFKYQKRKTGADGVRVYRTFGGSNYLEIKHGAGSLYERGPTEGAVTIQTYTEYGAEQGYGVNAFIYDDVHTPNAAGQLLSSLEWSLPPRGAGVQPEGLVLMPNGWFAMFVKNTLYMSEPYRPHAWPYSMTFPTDIVGICEGIQSLVVATKDSIYTVNGAHPAAVSQARLPIPVGGVSQLGMCNIMGAVAIVSNDGIVLVTGSQASMDFSQQLFTRKKWRELYGAKLSSLRLSYHDGFLVGSFPDADGFAVRVDEAAGAFSRLTEFVYAAVNNPITDSLYITGPTYSLGGAVKEFLGGSSNMLARWHSKEYLFPKPERMGAIYIRCGSGANVIVTVYANGVAYYTFSANTAHANYPMYRLPHRGNGGQPGFSERWSVKIETTVPVYEFVMAQSPSELKGA